MGNCMNACLPRSSEDHHAKDMEATTTLHLQKQPRREVVEVKGAKRRTGGDMINESLKASGGEGNNYKDHDTQKNGGDNEGIVRVKIVLTKDELQWLMSQLNSNGEKRLENMLEEIEKGRKKVVYDGGKFRNGWKPSLENIMETPESVLELNPSFRL